VLLGTLYPLLLDALDMGKISVGPPYFNSVFVPLMMPLLFLIGLAPFVRWKKADLGELARLLRWAFAVSLIVALILPFTMGDWMIMTSVGLLLAIWIMVTIVLGFARRIRRGNGLKGISMSYYGMQTGHFGMAVFVVGVTMIGSYETEKDVRMDIGDVTTVGDYTFRFDGVVELEGPNYQATRGYIQVMKDGNNVMLMHPEKRIYNVQTMPMTEAAIDSGFTRDLYVSLGEPVSGGAWSVRIYHKPFVNWIWGGCALMALGGFFAMSDRRYRIASRQRKEVEEKKMATANSDAGGSVTGSPAVAREAKV